MFIKGRDNLALTIMVPYDCSNNCKFCISKKLYKDRPADKEAVIEAVKQFFDTGYDSYVKDVVITGGEPMQDIYTLSEIINLIPADKNIYINTTFITENLKEFVFYVNTNPRIKGINISRHTPKIELDRKIMRNIADDDAILMIRKPVRINCVINDPAVINTVVARWTALKHPALEVSFRADFTKTDPAKLHNPYDSVTLHLVQNDWEYVDHTFCHVCDTVIFKTPDNFYIRYHRGLKTTSIRLPYSGNNIEVNDFVISQDGKVYFDWDLTEENQVHFAFSPASYDPVLQKSTMEEIIVEHDYISSCGGGISSECYYTSCGGSYTYGHSSGCGGGCPYTGSCGTSGCYGSCGGRSGC